MKALYILLISCFCVSITLAQSDIASLEYFIDIDPGVGLATNLDIDPDTETIDQNFNISTSGLSVGIHRLFIRAINTDGDISLFEHKTFRITPTPNINTSNIVEAEYFFNQDPGVGNATVIDLLDAETIDEALNVSASGLSTGIHRLFIRVKNSNNQWSLYDHKTFLVAPTPDMNTSDIVEAEYFFNQDPGVGNATVIDLLDAETIDEALNVSTSGLLAGTHRLFIRVKNSNNQWSLYEHKTFRIASPSDSNAATITAAEFFIDADPGVGAATPLMVSGDTIDENLVITTSASIADGTHFLYVRTQNADGEWSLYERQEFMSDGTLGVNTEEIASIKIFPNPTTSYLNISLSNNNFLKSAVIYNLYGKEIFKTNNSLEKIDLSKFQSGTYLLLLKTEKGNKSLKIIKN